MDRCISTEIGVSPLPNKGCCTLAMAVYGIRYRVCVALCLSPPHHIFGATSKSASNDHRAARIQELVTVSPYFGSPVGAVRSPAHPQRGLEADLVLDGSRTIFRAATGTAISEMRCYAWENGLRHPVCIVRSCHHLARHVQGIF